MHDRTDGVNRYTDNFFQHIVNGIPKLLVAVAIIVIGYVIAKAAAAAVRKLLEAANLNKLIHAGKGGNIIQRAVPNPSGLLASATYWIIFLFAISIAVSALGIPFLVDFVRAIYSYLPNVIAAILIFLLAGAVSAGINTLVSSTMGDTATGKVVGTAAPILVMIVAVFMILSQLKIAPAIVLLTYGLVLGSASLGMALAFGLGGRDVAAKMLQDLYAKSQQDEQAITGFKQNPNQTKQRGNDPRNHP